MPEKKSTSTISKSVADNGPGDTDLGVASYRAEQAENAVIIFAFGCHPTPGYIDFFEQSPIRIFPPQFIFKSIPPFGIVPQVVTPFAIWVMFGASEPVEKVTVHDADGSHEIVVEQVSKALAASKQRATWVAGNVVRGRGGIFGRATTMATGEEGGGPTTMATGEEDITAPTTMATGEEGGGPTTMATGEEATFGGPPITTLAVGEETGGTTTLATTLDIGEESQTFRLANTTLAIGEEDPNPTTLAVGEENPTTQAVGEEGGPTTLALGEETTAIVRSSPFGTF